MQFATDFLGHFALTVGLHKALAAAEGARIVSVSSSGNLIAPVIFDDLHFNLLPYRRETTHTSSDCCEASTVAPPRDLPRR